MTTNAATPATTGATDDAETMTINLRLVFPKKNMREQVALVDDLFEKAKEAGAIDGEAVIGRQRIPMK